MGKTANITKRRRLAALFERGRLVHFDSSGEVPEPTDTSLSVWVGPPNPLQREQALREAQATRSRTILRARDDSDEGSEANAARGMLASLEDEGAIDVLQMMDEQNTLAEARRRVLGEKEWDDFNALRDGMRQWEEAGQPEDDPEWAPLLEKDRLFGEQVSKVAEELRTSEAEGLKLLGRHEVEKRIIDRTIERVGSTAFVAAYETWMLYYAIRDDEDHNLLFFEHPDELKELPDKIQEALQAVYDEFLTDPSEIKNSQGAVSSSDSQAPPVEPATSNGSGPEGSSE